MSSSSTAGPVSRFLLDTRHRWILVFAAILLFLFAGMIIDIRVQRARIADLVPELLASPVCLP